MKRKIFSLLSAMVIIMCTLFLLTGCGEEEETSKKSKKENTEANAINQVQENKDNAAQSNSTSNTAKTEIRSVITPFSGGIALVEGSDNKYYVINKEGKAVFSKNEKGHLAVSNGYISDDSTLYDSEGKVVAKDENKRYGKVSKSGYVDVQIKTKDVSGTSYTEQIEDLKGNKISKTYASNGNMLITYLFDDYYSVDVIDEEHNESKYYIINAKENTEQAAEDLLKINGLSFYDAHVKKTGNKWNLISFTNGDFYWINSDFSKAISYEFSDEYGFKCWNVILDKYFVGKGSQGGSSGQTKIFDEDGKVVKDFSNIGGIASIATYNNVIYVKTNTGYIYTMDENFNYIKEPQETQYKMLASYDNGVIAGEGKNIIVLDENLNVKETIGTTERFGSGDLSEISYDDGIYYTGGGHLYSIKLKQDLKIYE